MTPGEIAEMVVKHAANLLPRDQERLRDLLVYITSHVAGSWRLYSPAAGKPSRCGMMIDLKGFKERKIAIEWTNDEIGVRIMLDTMGDVLFLDHSSMSDDLKAVLKYCNDHSLSCDTVRYDPFEDIDWLWSRRE
jgi:hypothetical protein